MSKEIKMSDTKELDTKTIDAKVHGYKRELFEMKMQGRVIAMKKPHQVKILRKNIARLLMVKNTRKKQGKI